jgi:hypothetical protein
MVAIALVMIGAVALPRAAEGPEPVSYWSGIAKVVIVDMAARGGSPSAVDFAYVHAAIYDAVNAIDQRYTVFAVRPTTIAEGASEPAAVAAAAKTILKALFTVKAQQDFVDAQYKAFIDGIPAGIAKDHGIAVGTEVANAFLDLRKPGPRQDLGQDGRNANCASDARLCYTFGAGPGVYQVTLGASSDPNVTPAAQWVGILKPFAVKSQSQFRADGPPNLTSAQWADDYNETKTFGGDAAHSPTRTQEQTDIGWYYTDNPGAFGNRIIRQIAADQHLELADSARYFAQTYVTLADTFVNCWDSKRYYNFWRPVTAIRAGDTDGNDATEPDATWVPLALTPNHQEYPSAHGCFTGSVMNAAENFFGTKKLTLNLTACSVPGHPCSVTAEGVLTGGDTHSFNRTQDALKEVIEGRIFGGMHYRTSVVHGIVMSNKVAHYVAKNYFLPVEKVHAPQGPKENHEPQGPKDNHQPQGPKR